VENSLTEMRQGFADLNARIDKLTEMVRQGVGPRLDRVEAGAERAGAKLGDLEALVRDRIR
jgi:hypothetical protein